MMKYWNTLTTEAMKMIDKDKSLVVIPIAATEQHGAHLPVGTDTMILEGLLNKMVKNIHFSEFTVLVTPLLPIGKSNEHMDFSGTISFSTKTLYSMLWDICKSIKQHGFKKVLFMNSHGGNTDLLNLISRDLRIDLSIETYVFDWWFTSFWNEALEEIQDSGDYGVFHACELETSIMLALHRELVLMDKIHDELPQEGVNKEYVSMKGPVIFGWKTKDVSNSGVIGSPEFATMEKGTKLLEFATAKMEIIFKEILHKNYLS